MTKVSNNVSLLATLPKSGTWYSHTFFWCYDYLLRNAKNATVENLVNELELTLANHRVSNQTVHSNTLGLEKLYICHSVCPGFHESIGSKREKWESIHFPVPSYNWGENFIRANNDWDLLNPALNPSSKIVYISRNPLDHLVSYYNQWNKHTENALKCRVSFDGTSTPITNIHDYVFVMGGLSGFIKHYYTYQQMKLRFPNNVMLVTYENLTQNPHKTFYDILKFLGAEPDTDKKTRLFECALSACSKDSLMKLENKLNKSLAHGTVEGGRHICGGEIGKWRKHFVQDEIEAIEMVLNAYDMSLHDFQISDNNAADMPIEKPINVDNRQKYATEFFVNQLNESGKEILILRDQLQKMSLAVEENEENNNLNVVSLEEKCAKG